MSVEEVDPAESKRLRKEAKRKRKEAEAAAGAVEEVEVDPEEAKRLRKAAKRAAAEAAAAVEVEQGAAADEEDAAEHTGRSKLTKTQRKAAKREAAKLEQAEEAIDVVEDSAAADGSISGGNGGGKGKGEGKGKSKGKNGKSKCKDGKRKDKGGKGKDKGVERNNELTVFVANLPFAVKGPALREHFAQCGEIDRFMLPMVDMVRQLYPKGIAFLQYATQEAVAKALALNDTKYGDRVISVAMAGQERKAKTVKEKVIKVDEVAEVAPAGASEPLDEAAAEAKKLKAEKRARYLANQAKKAGGR